MAVVPSHQTTSAIVQEEEEQHQQLLRLLLPPTERYAHGFKYCKGCSKWIRPGDEVYYNFSSSSSEDDNNNNKRKKQEVVARCPTCKRKLKTKPRSLRSKERLAKLQGNASGVKRY